MKTEQAKQVTIETHEHTINFGVIGHNDVVDQDVYAVQIETTQTYQIGEGKPSVKKKVDCGLASPKVLKSLKQGNNLGNGFLVPHKEKHSDDATGQLLAVKPAFVADYAKYGSSFPSEDRKDTNVYAKHNIKDPLKAAEAGEEFLLVEAYGYAGKCFNMQGVPYSQPIPFEYISGHTHNADYDLELAVEILLKDPRVELLPDGGERSYSYGKDKEQINYIGNIPGYNAEKGKNQCIAFYLRLPQEQYEDVYKNCKRDTADGMRAYIIESDLLGLIAGGAAKYTKFLGYYDNTGKTRNPLCKSAPKQHPQGCRCRKCDEDSEDNDED